MFAVVVVPPVDVAVVPPLRAPLAVVVVVLPPVDVAAVLPVAVVVPPVVAVFVPPLRPPLVVVAVVPHVGSLLVPVVPPALNRIVCVSLPFH